MGMHVIMSANLMCSFGTAPSTLIVTPENKVLIGGKPAATIMDHVPMKNILPFGMCTSMANPMVAAATAAALGVLTPMPCIPATSAPWIPGVSQVMIANFPVINNSCKLMCNWGGNISVLFAGQVQTMD